MSRFLSDKYSALEAYTPGEQPQDKKYIKLNTNESPYPPSPKVIEAVSEDETRDLRLYSDPESKKLKNAIAKRYGVTPDMVYVGNGSDEILNFSFMAFFQCEKGLVFPDISYGFYKVFGDLYGVNYTEAPLKDEFTVDIGDYISCGKNVVLANPNAPTGMALPLSQIEEIVKTNGDSLVLIDEAYVDFGGESAVPLTKKYDNLLVVQTFSKSRSLAGARLGFGIGNKAIIEDLEKIKFSTNPYNVNRLTSAAGVAAMEDEEYFREKCLMIEKTREYTEKELSRLGFNVLPSKTNFVFASHPDISGQRLYLELKDMGILVRYFGKPRIKDYVRITIGTDQDMRALIGAAEQILGKGGK